MERAQHISLPLVSPVEFCCDWKPIPVFMEKRAIITFWVRREKMMIGPYDNELRTGTSVNYSCMEVFRARHQLRNVQRLRAWGTMAKAILEDLPPTNYN